METTIRDQAHLVSDSMISQTTDPIEINQEDDFDFEIGGDDGFELTGVANDEDGNLGDQVGITHGQVYQADIHTSREQELHASVAGNHDDEDHDYGHQEVGASLLVPDSPTATAELSRDVQNDIESDVQDDCPVDLAVADQEETTKNVENFSEEEIFYEETAEEFEELGNTLEPEQGHDADLTNTATNVPHVPEGTDFQGRANETDDEATEAANNAAKTPQLATETPQNVEIAEDFEPEDHAQIAGAAAEVESSEAADESNDAILANSNDNGEAVAESLEQSTWDEEDDHEGSNAIPIVTVSYRGQEYSMFAQAPEDDPDTYFLDSVESVHRPLSQFLEDVRGVISSEVEAGHELFVRIDGLGLEFGESTANTFLDETTLAHIIEVNDKLSQNDGGSQHAELYILLSVRSNPLQRFAELSKGAEQGHGLSSFEQYYEESPADVSLLDDEEQQDVSQDIASDSSHPEDASGESQEAADGASNFLNVVHEQNSFHVDDQQLSLNDAAISEILEAQNEPEQIEAEYNTTEAINDGNVDTVSDVVQGGDDNSLGLAAANVEAIDDDNNFGDAISLEEQAETEAGEGWDHDEDVGALDGVGVMEAEEATDEQTELLINKSEEGHEHSNDSATNIPNDEDYLDLGHDAETQAEAATTDDNAAEQSDNQQRTTPNSSATATLNGEENGQVDEVVANQDAVDPAEGTSEPMNQNEDDEIDWNHEDDDDIGVADQNPTDLSPSSLSAKRSRQEDEGMDSLGEDSAAKRRRT